MGDHFFINGTTNLRENGIFFSLESEVYRRQALTHNPVPFTGIVNKEAKKTKLANGSYIWSAEINTTDYNSTYFSDEYWSVHVYPVPGVDDLDETAHVTLRAHPRSITPQPQTFPVTPVSPPHNSTELGITIDPIADQYLGDGGFFINGTTTLNSTEYLSVGVEKWPLNSSRKLMPGEFGGVHFNQATIRNGTGGKNLWYVFINTSQYNRTLSKEWLVYAYAPYANIDEVTTQFKLFPGQQPALPTTPSVEQTGTPPPIPHEEPLATTPVRSPGVVVSALWALGVVVVHLGRKKVK